MKSQAIFKSIEKLSDSRILDILFEGIKKRRTNDRSIGNLRRRAPDGNQMKGNIMWKSVLFKSKKKNGKKKRLKERLRIRSKKKKKKRKRRKKKKPPCRIRTPALSPEDLSFSAPHAIRPPAHGRVTSFPAHPNLTDK